MFQFLRKAILTILLTAFASQASAMFIEADWLDPTQPGVGTNRYAYSNNDPVNKLDPNGNWYSGEYGVYPTMSYNTDPNANQLLRAVDNSGRYIINTPTSLMNIVADGIYGAGNLMAPYSGTLENMAITTPTAFDDIGAGAISGFTKLSTSVAERSSGFVNPAALKFSQTTAGGNGRADALRKSMSQNGWSGPAIDVVQTSSGSLVTIDNTRVVIARELGMTKIPANIRRADELLPEGMADRFPGAKTWGDALEQRTSRNGLGGNGSSDTPKTPGTPSGGGGFGDWLNGLFN